MTATDVLRRMLDERGVEWEDASPVPSMKPWKTSFTSFTGEEVTISAYDEPKWLMGTMVFHTPEQAIAATLGSCNCSNNCTNSERTGTCHITDNGPWGYPYVCSACGASFDPDVNGGEFNYCPNCGRSIEQ